MHQSMWALGRFCLALVVVTALLSSAFAQVTNNIVYVMDGNIAWSGNPAQVIEPSTPNEWGGYGRFSYFNTIGQGTSVTNGPFGSITLNEPGLDGSGLGIDFYTNNIGDPTGIYNGAVDPVTSIYYPLIDRAGYGTSFDPNQYTIEIKYKPNSASNMAQDFTMIVDQWDGYDPNTGERTAEQNAYSFDRVDLFYEAAMTANELDADGFATIRNQLGGAIDPNQGGPGFYAPGTMGNADKAFSTTTEMEGTAGIAKPLEGNGLPDFDTFTTNGPINTPRGAIQFVLQTTGFGDPDNDFVDDWEFKSIVIRKINPDTVEMVRIDEYSGVSRRFGPAFQLDQSSLENPIDVDGTDRYPEATDQLQRFDESGFTNLILDTEPSTGEGSNLQLWQSSDYVVFDGNDAIVEIRAKLLPGNVATEIDLFLKDEDGDDFTDLNEDPNDPLYVGGDEYHYGIMLNEFDPNGFTTLQIPLTSFVESAKAFEFANAGDGLLTDFNLYSFGLGIAEDSGKVALEIDYMRVILDTCGPGDFDCNGVVDGKDFLKWQRDGLSQADLALWRANYGAGGLSASSDLSTVPEPASFVLATLTLLGAGTLRRRRVVKQ